MLGNQTKALHMYAISFFSKWYYYTCTVFTYTDSVGGLSSPWLVLKYLPNEVLKYFIALLFLLVEIYIAACTSCSLLY